MKLTSSIPNVEAGNWNSVVQFAHATQKNINKLASFKLGPTATPSFSSLTITGLTTSRLISTDASSQLTSVADLTSWIAGTANEISVASDGDGTVTIGLVDPLIVGKGGSGAATFTDHSILLGSGTDAFTALGSATNGQLPIGSTGADPVLATLTGTANQIAVTNGAGTITLSLTGNMDEIAALTPTDSNFIVGNGTTWVAESGDTARISLGVGTTNSPTFAGLIVDTDTLYVDSANHRLGVGTTAPDAEFHAQGTSSAVFLIERLVSITNSTSGIGKFRLTTSGNMADGFGPVIGFQIEDDAAAVQQIGFIGAIRDGADHNGKFIIQTSLGGAATIQMNISSAGLVGIGMGSSTANEMLEVEGTIRSNDVFNVDGTDGVTQASAAGKVCDITALAGGIATAQTQITYATNGTYNFDATSGKVDSITITNGRITAITTAE